jgi:4-carboxymuconolactone decarboxylase
MVKPPKTKTAGCPVNIAEAAHKNHEELFPNHQSTLQVTDPELIEIFDNFAFDEILANRGVSLPLKGQSTTTRETR